MKTKKEVETQDGLVNEVTVKAITSVFDYAKKICLSKNMFDDSVLYKKIVFFEGEYQDLLYIFGEHFNLIYSQLYFFQAQEEFETCEIMHKALNKELHFITDFILQNFPTLKADLTTMQDEFKEFYLN